MASRKDNLKSLFSNTRTRVVILFTVILLIFAVVVGYVKFRSAGSGPLASANLTVTPGGIQSIPGALDQTAQYAKLQEEQNASQAQKAESSGGSAIPTIIRTQALGAGVGVIGSKEGKSGVGFKTLALENEAGAQRSLWIQSLQNGSCSKSAVKKVMDQGAQISDLKAGCSCVQLKDIGYTLKELDQVCECKELKAAGYSARQLKDQGYSAGRLRNCGFDACAVRNAGFTAQEMKDGGFSDGELKGAGFTDNEIEKASGLPDGISVNDVLNAGCGVEALTKLRKSGVSASAIRRISGCTPEQLKAAGFSAKDHKDAGFTAAESRKAVFSAAELKDAGFAPVIPVKALANGLVPDCSVESLKKARAAGVSALTIRQTLGCSAKALKDAGYTAKELKDAGFTAAELKNAGFNAKDLKDAGFSAKELRDSGFTADELKNAGFSAKELKDAGFSAAELKAAGFTAEQLKSAGFGAKDLKEAVGCQDLKRAGYPENELKDAGCVDEASKVAGLQNPEIQTPPPAQPSVNPQASENAESSQQLQTILNRQNQQMADQKYQQKIQQRTSEMVSAANQSLQEWKRISAQVYMGGAPEEKTSGRNGAVYSEQQLVNSQQESSSGEYRRIEQNLIKTGDIVFAVMDTSVDSDEPGPILATIVSGKLKGTKLIGSFNLPSKSDQMIITFNTMSVPGAEKTTSISAYAIDPNTARTALSSRTNHHYLMRYGSLFASSFMQGFGNAFQSANTTVTIGGTGGGNDITVQNGIGRSTLQNAVIGLATVGKAWGQQAQQLFNTPTTVEVYSGTGIGVLFTQDVKTL